MAISKTGTSHSSTTISNSTTEIDSEIHSFNHRGSPLLTDSTSFSVEDKVLASHRGVFYEAKVLKIQHDAKELKFFVHYLGWSKHWDEWVGLNNLVEYTEENVQKYEVEKSIKPGRSSRMKPKVVRGRKRKYDSVMKDNGAVFMEKLVNIQMPPTLKKQLNDDSVFVTNMGKLVKLPRTPNVHDIFNTYVDYREKKDGSFDDTIRPFVQSFEFYFDKALPAMLLYQCERRQFEEATTDDISPSTVYGAEHLLRLFVKFPEILYNDRSDTRLTEEELTDLQQRLVDFLKFLRKNQSAFFLSTYPENEDIETSTNKQDD
ncbi:protein MRG2 isoform X2 [Morus notabilis]|uniref:protein MRG2 isoform X2 n=1 Tax=Morus notabilis TaxID=981085 RepID=UPI000CED39C7|nr:protein MRG2 isoform X2 [Morus notabilis]